MELETNVAIPMARSAGKSAYGDFYKALVSGGGVSAVRLADVSDGDLPRIRNAAVSFFKRKGDAWQFHSRREAGSLVCWLTPRRSAKLVA